MILTSILKLCFLNIEGNENLLIIDFLLVLKAPAMVVYIVMSWTSVGSYFYVLKRDFHKTAWDIHIDHCLDTDLICPFDLLEKSRWLLDVGQNCFFWLVLYLGDSWASCLASEYFCLHHHCPRLPNQTQALLESRLCLFMLVCSGLALFALFTMHFNVG